ncbi:MAG: gamma-glutamyltransferase family protein [Ottowia sp.]|nr:gamma-glutamyltransferase family protein [Ottowia sp.]
MIVAAHPLAAAAGHRMLRAGGSAIDATIATQLVLALVEPQSSGLGGGAVMLVLDNNGEVLAYDGRETAPRAANEDLFLIENQPMDFEQAIIGGRAVGVPGVLRMLALAHQRHGKLPWAELFQPAIHLAENGFIISPRLASLIAKEPRLKDDPHARKYFYDTKGQPKTAGTRLRNPLLARTLRTIASAGVDAFYRGKIATHIVDTVQQHPNNPGLLSLEDLADYHAKIRPAICAPFRRWTICGMPPPSSGGIAVAQILGILATQAPLVADPTRPMAPFATAAALTQNAPSLDQAPAQNIASNLIVPQHSVPNPASGPTDYTIEQAHRFSEAGKLAFADRDRYVADSDFVPLPGGSWKNLLDPAYLAERATLIGPRSMDKALPGIPLGAAPLSSQSPNDIVSTSQVCAIDAHGQAVSLTTSIETAFGAHIMVDGFLLNNQLSDFSFTPKQDGQLIANRVEARKRPRSSMAPTLVLEDGKLKMIVGSPGGAHIINYVAKVLMATLDWGISLDDAIRLPNIGSRNGPTEVEIDRTSSELITGLQALGHQVKTREMNSGLHAIMRIDDHNAQTQWLGVADPRREGIALGD